MRQASTFGILGALLLAAAARPCGAGPAAVSEGQASAQPPGKGPAQVGSVTVDPQGRAIVVTGWVNQVSGLVELFACGPRGKTHESVLVLDASPLDVQTGLLLLSLAPGTPPQALGKGQPAGSELDLFVHWEQDGTARVDRAESFLQTVRTGEPLPPTAWLFTGSAIENGRFMALIEESIVATFWDPWAIVNIPLPCGANDEALAVNARQVPPLNTAVRLEMRAR